MRRNVAVIAGCLLLAACHPAAPSSAAAPAGTAQTREEEGVKLTPEQIGKIGLVTEPAKRVEFVDEAVGYGVVLSHDTIAQGAAELVSAEATVRQSRSALARARKLAGTPGAVAADVEEAAAQKAAVDEAALTLATEHLSSILGMNPPWKTPQGGSTLRELASGRLKLLRATFPLGNGGSGGVPTRMRAVRIGAAPASSGWRLDVVWDAPADAGIPGRSYFALLRDGDAGEGERLQVWAPVGTIRSGVRVPGAAVVLSNGTYWCYVEKQPGRFVRVAIDTSKPLSDGYFTADGVAVGDNVVTTAVGQLLATETGGGAEPD